LRPLLVRRLLAVFGLVGLSLGSTPPRSSSAFIVQNRASRITTWEVGTGRTPVILMHGYASSPQAWLPFASTILVPLSRRFVFPRGPEITTPPDGPEGGRAWWRLDLASYPKMGRTGRGLSDLSRSRPEGLGLAAKGVQLLCTDLYDRLGYHREDLIVGGFSQGAMVAAELAFRSREPLRALVLLSGTPVDEQSWLQGMRFRRGLPVFIAHGRQDDVLPFRGAERLQQTMREIGLQVTWVPFNGGHETPAEVVAALNQFLAGLDGAALTTGRNSAAIQRY
jgi:phospholipase/carboxylesterase